MGLQRTRNTGYVAAVDDYNTKRSEFFAKLTVPESTAGMAGQWAVLGGFDWASVTLAAVETRINGEETRTITADAEGIVRLLARLCTIPQAPVQAMDGELDRAQVLTLSDEGRDMARVYWTGENMYLDTGGMLFAVDAPPWLFGELMTSVLGGLLISQPEAEDYAAYMLDGRTEMTGGSAVPVSAQLTGTGGRYGWDVLYDTANGRVCVSIESDSLTRIEPLDE